MSDSETEIKQKIPKKFISTVRANPVGKPLVTTFKNKNKIQLLDIDPDNVDISKIDMTSLDPESDNVYDIAQLKQVASNLGIVPPKNRVWTKMGYINAIKDKLEALQNKEESEEEEKVPSPKPKNVITPKKVIVTPKKVVVTPSKVISSKKKVSESESESEEEIPISPSPKKKLPLKIKKKPAPEESEEEEEEEKTSKVRKNYKATEKKESGKKFLEEENEIQEEEEFEFDLDNDDDGIITLSEEQERHYNVLMKILNEFHFALDPSALGAGKTYTAMMVYLRNKFKHLIYISTPTMIGKVKPVLEKYGLPTKYLITFPTLRSVKGSQPAHGLLRRIDLQQQGKTRVTNKTSFEVTKNFEKMVSDGCLLILDEVQHIKNDSLQNKAASALEEYIIKTNGKSRILELSGAYANKEEHFINVMYRFMIVTAAKFFDPRSNYAQNTGITQLENWCRLRNPIETARIMAEHRFVNKSNYKNVAFDLISNIVMPIISDEMPPPPLPEGVELDVKNGFYGMSRQDQPYFDENLQNLMLASNYESGSNKIDWKLTKKSIRNIEISEINIYCRLGMDILTEHKNNKLIIALNYTIPLKTLTEFFESKGYGVIVMNGKVKPKLRQGLIDKFNEANNRYRVFIGNIAVINASIDLNDTDGRFPRYVLASPSYFFINQHQLTGRTVRGDKTKSSTIFRFVYVNINNDILLGILNKLAAAGKLCTPIHKKQVMAGIKFPGTYDQYHEEPRTIPPGPYKVYELIDKAEKEKEKEEDEEPQENDLSDDDTIKECLLKGKTKPTVPRSREEKEEYEEEIEASYKSKPSPKKINTTTVKKTELIKKKPNSTLKKVNLYEQESEESEESEEEGVSPMLVPSPSTIVPIKKKLIRKNKE